MRFRVTLDVAAERVNYHEPKRSTQTLFRSVSPMMVFWRELRYQIKAQIFKALARIDVIWVTVESNISIDHMCPILYDELKKQNLGK